MGTEYIHTLTAAVPEAWVADANHLACIIGESARDIATFDAPTHTDGEADHVVIHTVVRPTALEAATTGTLPDSPPHAEGLADRAAAQAALDTLNTPGGIQMRVDMSEAAALADMGMELIDGGEGGA